MGTDRWKELPRRKPGIHMEKRMLDVLKALSEYSARTMGDLLGG